MPNLQGPPFDRDEDVYLWWFTQRFNNWNYGENPAEDPGDANAFVQFLTEIKKQTNDLSAYKFPAFAPIAPPAPTPEPAPNPAHAFISTRFGLVPEDVADAIAAEWPADLWVNAASVSYLESSWEPRARANTLSKGPCGTQYTLADGRKAMTEDSRGLFQINVCAHGGGDELYDPQTNARKGFEVYSRQGWYAWQYSSQQLGLI